MTDEHRDQIELRASIISLVLSCSAKMDGPFKVISLFEGVQGRLGLPEEECSLEIMAATGILIRSGILHCETYHAETDEIVYGAGTMLRASPALLRFVWRDTLLMGEAMMINGKYNLRTVDLLYVGAVVGGIHYVSSLLLDYHSAFTISGATNSADVGVTAAFGALVYSAYCFFRSGRRTVASGAN